MKTNRKSDTDLITILINKFNLSTNKQQHFKTLNYMQIIYIIIYTLILFIYTILTSTNYQPLIFTGLSGNRAIAQLSFSRIIINYLPQLPTKLFIGATTRDCIKNKSYKRLVAMLQVVLDVEGKLYEEEERREKPKVKLK